MFSLFGYAAPVFWTGILLLIAFSLHVPIFPVSGMRDITIETDNFFVHFFDVLSHLFLPMITSLEGYTAYEVTYREMVVMGLRNIARGESPRNIQDQMVANLPPAVQQKLEAAA